MLERDDLIRGLRELVARLRERGEPAGVRIVGGAALSLRYFERRTTDDIDAKIHPLNPTMALASEIATENRWPEDSLNTAATQFLPVVNDVWVPLYDSDTVSVWVGGAPMLLAMKLRASRPGRDDDDIANLLVICGVTTVDSAEELYESHYPGEILPEKARRMMEAILSQGLPDRPKPPPLPNLG